MDEDNPKKKRKSAKSKPKSYPKKKKTVSSEPVEVIVNIGEMVDEKEDIQVDDNVDNAEESRDVSSEIGWFCFVVVCRIPT